MAVWAMTVVLALVCAVGATSAMASNAGYVSVNGPQFTLDGNPYYFVGVNFWQGMNLGIAGAGGDRSRLARELDRLRALGITNVRIMASSEGPNEEPYRMVPALQTSPGVYDAAVLDGLDYLMSELDQRGMRAVMVLNNFWHWSGGMAQYVSWAQSSSIPYPPSYPDFTGNWNDFMNYADDFYGDPQAQTWFRDHISTLINHTNLYTGRTYRNEPTIFAWELANEPRQYPASWIDETADFIKSLDANHMVTTGSEGAFGAGFVPTHDGPSIDYATVHIWPQNWGWYNPENPATYAGAEANARTYLQNHLDDAAGILDKPLVLEEFGLARDWEPLHNIYDPNSPTTNRDEFFRAMLDDIYDSASTGGPAAGTNFWVWGGEARPGNGTVGDPPHEIPGWYPVYDDDVSTHDILTAHFAQMQSLIPDVLPVPVLPRWGQVLLLLLLPAAAFLARRRRVSI